MLTCKLTLNENKFCSGIETSKISIGVGYVRYLGCTAHSLSNFESRLNHVSGGTLVFEIGGRLSVS